jgi:hypothetical protein
MTLAQTTAALGLSMGLSFRRNTLPQIPDRAFFFVSLVMRGRQF